MLVCQCGNKVEYLFTMVNWDHTHSNRSGSPKVFDQGVFFCCGDCMKSQKTLWEEYNIGRNEQRQPVIIPISINANTYVDFYKRFIPQLVEQKKRGGYGNIYITDKVIKEAIRQLSKRKI